MYFINCLVNIDEAYAMKLQLEEDYAALVRQEKDQSSHVDISITVMNPLY